MPRYGFYSKGRWTGEVIKSTYASTPAEAVKFFAELKKLSVDQFVQIYEVIER